MSETFFIKNTAFDDFSNDINDRENTSFIIGPGELNGPGGREPRMSDLELHGFGTLKWGEGVNQNFFRMLENFACPQKTTGSPPVAVLPIQPISETELGLGNGITIPIVGQTWFNTSDEELYMYTDSGIWRLVTQTLDDALSLALTIHIADMTVHLTSDQNTFLDGLNLPTLTSTDVNQLVGIRTNDGTVQDQIDLMVDTRGDTMTGSLIMQDDLRMDSGNITLDSDSSILLEAGQHRITNNDGGGNFNIRIGHEFSGANIYTGTGGAIHLLGTHEGSGPEFNVLVGDSTTNVIGTPVTFSGQFSFGKDGNLSSNSAAATSASHFTTRGYADGRYVNVTGDSMNSGTHLIFGGGGEVRGLGTTPSTSTSATSKSYVDTQINTRAPKISPVLSGTPRSVTFGSTDNSTRIATTAFVQSATTSTAEVAAMIRTYDEAELFGKGGYTFFPPGGTYSSVCRFTGLAYYCFSDGAGIGPRGTWNTMRGVTGFTSSDSYFGTDFNYSVAAAPTNLARVRNYTSKTITWQCQYNLWLSTDDTAHYRLLQNGVSINWQSKAPNAQCSTVSSAISNTITVSRTIPSGAIYTWVIQGTVTGGWGLDVIAVRNINYNRILF